MWTYRARLIKVVDGDTVDLSVDLGFGVSKVERVRLAGLNTPEMNAGGTDAKLWVSIWFADHTRLADSDWPYQVRTQKALPRDKYGRWVGDIWFGDSHLNAALLESGLAVPYPPR